MSRTDKNRLETSKTKILTSVFSVCIPMPELARFLSLLQFQSINFFGAAIEAFDNILKEFY